jgi:hypothetical protein
MPKSTLPIDFELSRAIAEATHAKPKECWLNAFALIGPHVEWKDHEALYVEGFIVVSVVFPDGEVSTMLPVEHAWVEVADMIVEPTLAMTANHIVPLAMMGGANGLNIDYFPAKKFTREEVKRELEAQSVITKRGRFPLCWRQGGWFGMDNQEYCAARLEALAHVGIVPKTLPENGHKNQKARNHSIELG